MQRYLYIGEYKMPLNNNYDDKCDYLKSLHIKKQNRLQYIEHIKKEFVTDKVLNDDELFQRDYSFFSLLKPKYKETKALPKIKVYPRFKYTFKSPIEHYKSYKDKKSLFFEHELKNSLISFPMGIKNLKTSFLNKSNSLLYLPMIKK